MHPDYKRQWSCSLLLLLKSLWLAQLLPLAPRLCTRAVLARLPAVAAAAATSSTAVTAASVLSSAAILATPARTLPVAAAPQRHSPWRATAVVCVLLEAAAAAAWTSSPGAATGAAIARPPASTSLAAAGSALLDAAVSAAIKAARGRGLAGFTAAKAAAVAPAVQRRVQSADAGRLLATAAVSAAAMHTAAAGAAADKAEVTSSVLALNRRTPHDGRAAAGSGIDQIHPLEDDLYFFFLLPERVAAAAYHLLLIHWRLVVFVLLVLLWFAIAAWVPVHILPLLLLPAYVRTHILQQVQEARAVLARAKQQQAAKQQHHQEGQPNKQEGEAEEELQQLSQSAQELRPLGEWQHNTLRQRCPAERRGGQHQEERRQTDLHLQQQQRGEGTEQQKQTREAEEAKKVRDARETLRVMRNRGMGFLHSILASALGTYCLFFDEALQEDRMHSTTLFSTLDNLLLTSYFTWDLTAIVLHWRRDSAQWLLHCVVSLLAILHPLTATAREPCMSYYAVALSLFELSTPFLALRYFCVKASVSSSGESVPAVEAAGRDGEKTAVAVGEESEATHATASGPDGAAGSGGGETAPAEVTTAASACRKRPGEAAALAERKEEAEARLHASAAPACVSTSCVEPSTTGNRAVFPSCTAAAGAPAEGAGTVAAAIRKGDAVAVQEHDAPERAIPGNCAGAAAQTAEAGTQQVLEEAAPAAAPRRVGGNLAEASDAGAAGAATRPPRLLRLYEVALSAAFTLTFFFVRIVWGNLFLFPEIYAQILSAEGDTLLPARKTFFLCAVPVFAALNCFWMLLLIKLLLHPTLALKR